MKSRFTTIVFGIFIAIGMALSIKADVDEVRYSEQQKVSQDYKFCPICPPPPWP